MAESSPFDRDRLSRVRSIVNAMYAGLVKEVITHIKAMPKECRLSGDDSVLADFWEEFKYQVQREESFAWDVYVEAVQASCAGLVESLDRERQGLLWLWSEACIDWEANRDDEEEDRDDHGEIPYGDPVNEALTEELYQRVCSAAEEEELAIDPDEERDRERIEEDSRLNQWKPAPDDGSTQAEGGA